jgi:MFS family permease
MRAYNQPMAAGELSDQQLENRRKAFEFADAWAKLLASLATGTLVLSATFIKDIFPDSKSLETKGILFAAWIVLGISAFMGPMVLGALVAHLNRASSTRELDVYSGSIQVLSILQICTFFLGLVLFSTFVAINL